MGIQSIGAAAATTAPISLNRPIFTYNNAYTNAFAAHTLIRAAATYNPSDTSIIWANDNWIGSTTLNKFNITTNTFSQLSAVLPATTQEQYDIVCGSDGTLGWVQDRNSASSFTYYHSTNNGSTWTGIASLTNINCLFPIGSNLRTKTNNSDSVPFGLLSSTTDVRYWNRTANANYAGTLTNEGGYTGNSAGTTLYKKLFPIRKGDDSFDINGYFLINGQTNNGSGPASGTYHVMSITGTAKRNNLFFGHYTAMPQEAGNTGNSALYSNVQFYTLPGQMTCIENRWFLGNSNLGFYLFDFLNKSITLAPMAEAGRGYFTTQPIYISATKKLYIYNSDSQTMTVFDVTFE